MGELFALSLSNLLGGILCLLVGLITHTGKANFLIAGYNTMSETERANWNIEAIYKFMGRMLIIISVILLIGGGLILLNVFPWIAMWVSWGIFFAVSIFGVIYMNVSPKFKRKK